MEAFLKKQVERNKRQLRRERKDVDRFTNKARKRATEASILADRGNYERV